jgi:hypothetical protein
VGRADGLEIATTGIKITSAVVRSVIAAPGTGALRLTCGS